MKDIFSTNFTFQHSKKVIFDIVKDDKNDKILVDKIIGLEIDEWLKNHGCKAIFNRIEKE